MIKINDALLRLPAHTVITTKFLKEFGISRQLLNKYIKSKWFEHIAKGAVKRYGDKLSLHGAIYALQQQLSLPVHIGARSSLELQGLAHNIRIGNSTQVFLFKTEASTQLPSWFKTNFGKNVIFKNSSARIAQCHSSTIANVLLNFNCGDYTIKISSLELAIIESCYLVPAYQSFEECYNIVAGLVALRPHIMQDLLIHCDSIRAKRLFLFMAFKAGLPLVKYLDLNKIDLGTGKIQVVANGIFDPKFMITVPHIFKGNNGTNNSESLF